MAEAETLSLSTTAPASTVQSPLKVKQLQGQGDAKTTTSPMPESKSKAGATIDKPCKWVDGAGCRAGKSCKWQHSWDGIDDKASRCWICGGRDHVKNGCKLKATNKKHGEPPGSGGGNRQGRGGSGNSSSTATATSSTMGGKAGAAAAEVLNGTAASTSEGSTALPPQVTNVTPTDGKGGGSDGTTANKSDKTTREAEPWLNTNFKKSKKKMLREPWRRSTKSSWQQRRLEMLMYGLTLKPGSRQSKLSTTN